MKLFSSILILLYFSSHLPSFAKEDYEVSYKINRTTVAEDENFTLSISIKYADKVPEFKILDLGKWEELSLAGNWSDRKSSITIINGKMESEKIINYHYQFRVGKKGKLLLPPLTLRIDNKEKKTKSFSIEVVKKDQIKEDDKTDSKLDPFSNFNLLNPFRGLPNQLLKNPFSDKIFEQNFSDPFRKTSPSLDLKLNLSKKVVYLGEMLRANWVVYVGGGGIELRDQKRPELRGFWRENLLVNAQPQFLGRETKNGISYEKNLISSYALFPVQTGKLTIDSYHFKTTSVGFFSRPGMEKTYQSKAREIEVLPLPSEGKGNFSGGVGSFKVKAWLSETQTEINKPIIFHLRFEGEGHPQFIKVPKIPFPSFLKIYEPSNKSFFSIQPNKNYKEFEILLSSKKKGEVTIPSFTFTTFDPKKKQYIEHTTSPLSFKVLQPESSETIDGEQFFTTKESEEIDYISKNSFFRSVFPFQHKSILFFYYILHSLFIAFFIFVYLKYFRGRKKEIAYLTVEKKLKSIHLLIQDKKYQNAAIQLRKTILFSLSQIVEIKSAEGRKLIENLPSNLHKNFADPLYLLIEELESISFSGKHLHKEIGQKMNYLLKQSETILNKIFENYKDFLN